MKKILFVLYFIAQNITTFAAGTDTLIITDSQTKFLTNQYFLELEDPNSILSVDNVINSHGFHNINTTLPVLKYSKSATWLKFTLKNNTIQPFASATISRSIIDEFDVYFVNKADHKLTHLSSKHPQRSLNRLNQNITFINLPIQPYSSNTFFARIKSNASSVLSVQIDSSDHFYQKRTIDNMLNAAFAGMFLIMALYNLMLFFIVHDKSYLYYVIYIIFLGLSQILLMGYGNNLFPGNKAVLNCYLLPCIRVLFGYSLLLFVGEFLQLKQNIKPYRYYLLLYVLYTLPLIAIVAGKPHMAYTLIGLTASFTAFTLLLIGGFLYIKGYKPAKFFMIGWSFFLLSLIVTIARNNGLLPYNYITVNIIIYSSLIELILFSVALADKINFYRHQKNESHIAALSIAKENERLITEQNILLENKVKERTRELIQTNQNLSVTIDNLKSAQIQLIETEKMASLGQLTAGVAHEINNPMNFISANVKPLRTDFDEIFSLLNKYEAAANNPGQPELLNIAADYKQQIDADFVRTEILTLLTGIEEGASRTTEIVQSLRTFSRMDDLILKPANVNAAVLNALIILRSFIPYYIEIKPVLDKLEPLNSYSGKINQVIINLISNSIHAIKAKETHQDESIVITTSDHPDHVSIEVTDTGVGMAAEVKQRIFEPFYTTKNIGEGTGLGLSIVFGIIEKHHGTIHVKSAPGKGTSITITLPKNLGKQGDV